MKTFLTILLALPTAFAAPAAKAGRQVKACACANAAGQTKIDGYCPYIAGSNVNVDGQDYVSYLHPSPLRLRAHQACFIQALSFLST